MGAFALQKIDTLFKNTNVDDLLCPQSVVILKDTATVEQALKTLAAKRILSAPVVSAADAEAKASQGCGCLGPLFGQVPPGAHWPQEKGLSGNDQILGFLDVRDVLSSFLAELEGKNMSQMKMLQRMRILEEKGQVYASTQIKDLKVFGGDGDFFHIKEAAQTTVKELIMTGLLNPTERCARQLRHFHLPRQQPQQRANGHQQQQQQQQQQPPPSFDATSMAQQQPSTTQAAAAPPPPLGAHTGKHIVTGTVHRVAIYDSHFRIKNIISQTDIIKFLHMNKSELGDLATKTAAELGWCPRPVVSLGPDVSAIEAMLLMNQKQISAVAVVDGVGKIIGNFSVSEMRTIMAEHFGALALPVGEFLALEHGTEFQGYSHIHEQEVVQSKGHKFITDRVARDRPRTPGEEVGQELVLVKPDAPFTEILEKIVSHKIHRVYIIDYEEKPCGVVTCTDVLRLVIKATQHQLKIPADACVGVAAAAATDAPVTETAVQPEIMDVQAEHQQMQQ